MNRDELRTLLWDDVQDVASGFDLNIEPDCEARLHHFVDTGTERIVHEKLLNNRDCIAEAETNLIAFVGGMAFQAKMQKMDSLNVWIFDRAREIFCPLFPFC